MTNYEKLEKILTELFQLDKAELDFGIYRIMNQKRDDVLDFLNNTLPKEVRTILEGQKQGDANSLKKELDNAIKTAKDFGAPDPEATSKVQEARAAYESAGSIDGLEQEVFSHLASFFKRYYEGGDFISLRRYKQDVYAIPYEGEEVKLHWANHDQYYIKTSENLKNYAFKIDGDKTVKFTLKEANTEQNNNKTQNDQERRFALYEEEPVTIDGKTIHLNFTYEPYKKSVKQDKLLESAVAQLTEKVPAAFTQIFSLATTEKNKKRTLLEKHLNDFSARNTFDYFIHKDLGGFLTRELDFYIKNEVLFIDDINTDNEQAFTTQLSKIRALKQVAGKIITFLAQLENFQKKLWLKKKFVISCDYCITLDRIPENYYNEIANNPAQLSEWKTLFDVDIKKQEDLKDEPYLVLDTKFFSQEFKDKLLAEFDDLDEQTNGVLINSENFQGLNTLQKKYNNKIQQVYIDPPYNTDSNEIVYKNGFKHSSWLSFINDRLSLSDNVMKKEGVLNIAIDSAEQKELGVLLKNKYQLNKEVHCLPVIHNPRGIQGKNISYLHEYLYFVYDKDQNRLSEVDIQEEVWEYSNLRNWGGESERKFGKTLFYPVTVNLKSKKIIQVGDALPENEHPQANICLDKNTVIIYPIDSKGIERKWRFSIKRLRKEKHLMRIGTEKGGNLKIEMPKTSSRVKSIWIDKKFDASVHGKQVLTQILPDGDFSFPKSIYNVIEALKSHTVAFQDSIVLDYFGGSGTTAHAVIKLNRDLTLTNNNYRYILVEMGEYFNTVTKPRIQKVIYTDNWKNGKPQDKEGISQIFKYFNLESYEDTLNNLQLKPNQAQQQLLDTNSNMQEEYLLQYMLDVESRDQLLNIEAFKNPFSYKLNITENNELVPTNVDLVETFNYLIGLHTKRVQRTGAFKTVEGVTNTGDKLLVIWRNLEESNNDDLNAFVKKMDYNFRDGEFDTIYVNGDNNLANLRQDEETWKVLLLEEVFFTAMFDNKDI